MSFRLPDGFCCSSTAGQIGGQFGMLAEGSIDPTDS